MSEVLRIVVSGRVQGVGFRYYTEQVANRLGVSGWVRNLPTGEVEIMARLDEADREALLAALRQGPPGARVERVRALPVHRKAGEEPEVPARGFRVRF